MKHYTIHIREDGQLRPIGVMATSYEEALVYAYDLYTDIAE